MGLGSNHAVEADGYSRCCPGWSYGGFNRFRKELAKAEGFDLDEMQGFSKGDWDLDGDRRVPGTRSWDEITSDLKPLLDHSDCDGELSPEECTAVAPRLRKIVRAWLADDYDRINAEQLADCMDKCAVDNVNLEFC